MSRLILTNARILTLAGPRGPRRGAAMGELGILGNGEVAIEGDRIAGVGPAGTLERTTATREHSLGGRVLMPAFTDCHTHACFAGERYGETAQRLAGVPYLDILAAGGGIMSTVRAVRASSEDELVRLLMPRLHEMRRHGTANIEVKSGYGLDLDTEMRMLRAIRRAGTGFARQAGAAMGSHIVPTFLGAHAIDGDPERYFDETVERMLPAVVERFGPIACDAYCEKSAWSPAATRRLFERAKALGCPLRVHVDQFNELGFLDEALALGARTVDHLEATGDAALERVAKSNAIAVMLPGSGLTLDLRFANARRLIDAGGAVAIATNCNPGSSPLTSMPLAIALAARFLRLTHAEAIVAACWNSACALALSHETGSIEVGKRADLVALATDDERTLAYEWSAPPPSFTVVSGVPFPGRDAGDDAFAAAD